MQHDIQNQTSNWRKHWLVANVFAEIPVIGSFCKETTTNGRLHDAAKCAASFAGAGVTFMWPIFVPAHDHKVHVGEMLADMGIGMSAGKVLYNVCFDGGTLLYHYMHKKLANPTFFHDEEVELQSAVAPTDNALQRDSRVVQVNVAKT